ncbi:MAG: 30S ribosomal protein S6 [Thermodesulfovibrionales bacterium]
MVFYENVVIINAALSDEDITAAIDKIKSLITNNGGDVLKVDNWGRRKLAYEIKKQTKGFYTMLVFKAPAATIKKLEEYYKVFDPVVKHMVIKMGPKQVKQFEAYAQAAAAAASKEA